MLRTWWQKLFPLSWFRSRRQRRRKALRYAARTTRLSHLLRLEERLAPATLVALNAAGNALLRFDSSTPGTVVATPVTGLGGGESLQGIDFRPATGQLFGLGVTGTAARLLTINVGTGAATVVGTLSQPVSGSDV